MKTARLLWIHKWGLGLIIILVLISSFIVHKWKERHPGSMTVLESQAMDMTAMGLPEGAVPVAVEKVESGPFSSKANYVGSVLPFDEQQVFTRVEGYVKSIPFYDGDFVTQGQTLTVIDTPELSSRTSEAQNAVKVAIAEKKNAQIELKKMYIEKEAALGEYDAASAEVNRAEAMFLSAKTVITQREQELKSAKAELEYQSAEISREKKLLDSGAVSVQEYQADKAMADKAHAEVESREAILSQARQDFQAAQAELSGKHKMLVVAGKKIKSASVAIDQAKAEIDKNSASVSQMQAMKRTSSVIESFRIVKAPMSGYITRRLVSPGQYVNPSTAILGLAKLDKVRLQFQVSEDDSRYIHPGTTISAEFVENPDIHLNAKITSVSPDTNQVTRTALVEAIVNNPGMKIKSGNSVSVSIATKSNRNAITVHDSAIIYESGKTYVWTVVRSAVKGKTEYFCTMHPQIVRDHPGNCPICLMKLVPRKSSGNETAHRVEVTINGSSNGRTEISYGLTKNDEVIYQGNTYLKEADVIYRTTWSTDGPDNMPHPDSSMKSMPGMPGMSGKSDMKNMQNMPDMPGMNSQIKPKESKPVSVEIKKSVGKTIYTCPMHPEVVSYDPKALCPKCGMHLVKKEQK